MKKICGNWSNRDKKCYWLEWYTPDGCPYPFYSCHLGYFKDGIDPYDESNCIDFIEQNNNTYNENLNKIYKKVVCYKCGRKYPVTILNIKYYRERMMKNPFNKIKIRCINVKECKRAKKELKQQIKNNKLKGALSIVKGTQGGELTLKE